MLKSKPLNEGEIVSEFRYRVDDAASLCPARARTVDRLVAAHDAEAATPAVEEVPLTTLQARRACRVGQEMMAQGAADSAVSDYYADFTLESKMLLPRLCPQVLDFYRAAGTRQTTSAGSDSGSGLPPPKNECEAQTDYLGEEFAAGNLTESEYDDLLNENWDTCYASLPDN